MLPERRLAGSKLPVKSCEDVISWPERACRWEQLSLSLGAVTIAQSCEDKTRLCYPSVLLVPSYQRRVCEDTITLPERACRREQLAATSCERVCYQSERVAGSSYQRRVVKTRVRTLPEGAPRWEQVTSEEL